MEFPKARRIKETRKKIIGTTQPQQKLNIENIKATIPLINKQVKTVVNKPENTGKGMEEYNMGYHIVEDINKTKENISLLELCNIPQQKKKLLEAFDPQPSVTIEVESR